MKFLPGVILKEEKLGGSASEVTILTVLCPKGENSYRIPLVRNEERAAIPKFCPYCGKKLVKRK